MDYLYLFDAAGAEAFWTTIDTLFTQEIVKYSFWGAVVFGVGFAAPGMILYPISQFILAIVEAIFPI